MIPFIYFFGGINDTIDSIKKKYPEFTFLELNQVHGDKFVQASSLIPEADAHWTSAPNTALIIKTADCIPILITHPDFVCAIHAGWRGVLNEITFKTLKYLLSQFGNIEGLQIHLGPHIQKNSFEISKELLPEFQMSAKKYSVNKYYESSKRNADKFIVHLSTLVLGQIKSLGVSESQILIQNRDTMTDLKLHSFRRSKQPPVQFSAIIMPPNSTGRNYSFVARREKI